MAVRPINAINLKKYIQGLDVSLPYDEQDKEDIIKQVCCIIDNWPTLTPPNEPLTWEGLKSEIGNPVYSIKHGWMFPRVFHDAPYKQVWFFTSKGQAEVELFYHDKFYRRPPEEEEDTNG